MFLWRRLIHSHIWDVIGGDVGREIRDFFSCGSLHPRHNENHIRLIPKSSGPKKVADYRPIALCSVHYKIIAKILSKRLQPLLPGIISQCQELVFLLNDDGYANELDGILSDISLLLSSFTSVSFHFVSRTENSQADALAKAALLSCNVSSPAGV
ncbi:Ribonuclease H domain [Arabidopsis suecica]|uniref:Ribonuclease H domain n=1 Tax=Arabidopsis suecica TaxID=45249 RepID=A0A8T1ZUL0_ARASU|nr:Ribonuclease H domain [Arabidopsis suecica]